MAPGWAIVVPFNSGSRIWRLNRGVPSEIEIQEYKEAQRCLGKLPVVSHRLCPVRFLLNRLQSSWLPTTYLLSTPVCRQPHSQRRRNSIQHWPQ